MEIDLDDEEMELLKTYNNGEWVSIATPENIAKYRKIARNTLKQKKIVNVEISNEDLSILQEEALEKGSSYQSIISMIVHEYASHSKNGFSSLI
jgi:predicted DNA binding CopG/RHH family protein